MRRALDHGLTIEQAAERIRLEEFSSFGQYVEWRELNVRGAYRAMSGG